MEKREHLSKELQCVGKLEIARTRPAGFLCGSIPVSTDETFCGFTHSALVSSSATVRAPRYQMIPTETDLYALPLRSSVPDKMLPVSRTRFRAANGGPVVSNLVSKGEELAVCGVVDYEDEVDVIAPADVLKQILKIPYSKARVSVVVRRIGQTLILNSGPDVEEGERIIQRQSSPPKCVDQSLLLNFAMHSVRMEACDCPPTHTVSGEEQHVSFAHSDEYQKNAWDEMGNHVSYEHDDGIGQVEEYMEHQEFTSKKENRPVGSKRNNERNGQGAVKKASEVKERPRKSVQESENCSNVSEDSFLRVFFWQFHNFRMLLGSDMLIFSNDKHSAVSLHLWDVSLKVTPLAWLEAWLDNFMASVPELAICYHRDGVVLGYELLKTDDIFLLKGISEDDDGMPAFHPHVIQKNGLSVMKFLQENCQQDPGVYWLYRNAGEDVIQLFDLSVIPKNHSSDVCHDNSSSSPSFFRWGTDSVLSLGTLLYRIAHRLSLSWPNKNKARCITYFKKCFGLLEDPDHFVVRALAHEQFARLLLTYDDEDLELLPTSISVESEVTISDAFEIMTSSSPPAISVEHTENVGSQHELEQIDSVDASVSQATASQEVPSEVICTSEENDVITSPSEANFLVDNLVMKSGETFGIHTDPLAAKLAAVHHVSQAIKSLRWTRQLQSTRKDLKSKNSVEDDLTSQMDFRMCTCGVVDCIEICDIRDWLPTSKIDDRLWKLVLLLGESYLALGEAYKDDGLLYEALKVIELACLVYGSMPQDSRFISSIDRPEINRRRAKTRSSPSKNVKALTSLSNNSIFWAKSWSLVGDVFVEFYKRDDHDNLVETKKKNNANDLKMSSEVLKELTRLKKKLGQDNQNCSSCSLVNCSCNSDRANSGSSASSSGRNPDSSNYGKKPNRRIKNSHRSVDNHNNDAKTTSRDNGASRKVTTKLADAETNISLSASISRQSSRSPERGTLNSTADASPKTISSAKALAKCGGIFRYLRDFVTGDVDQILSSALNCYEESRKAMNELPATSGEVQSLSRKIGWVCNELGRTRLEARDIGKAEISFLKAIDAFNCVGDLTNIILILCNLGHGQRALAEDMAANSESHAMLRNAAIETAKSQYSEAIRYYGTAKAQLNTLVGTSDSVSSSLKKEVLTQFAHTYLRLGMLLSRENAIAEVYENCVLDSCCSFASKQVLSEQRKHTISANEAIREAISVYESLDEMRRQEAAYAYYQLAFYQRDCCLRFLNSDETKQMNSKGENTMIQKVKQYASLAERNWQKSSDFYKPDTHPLMHLTILIDRTALSLCLTSHLHTSSCVVSGS